MQSDRTSGVGEEGQGEHASVPQHLFGHYELLHSLGRGAIGNTYCARALSGGDAICLKILNPEYQGDHNQREAAIQSLVHEARVGESLRHRSIARVLDWGSYRDEWFIAFELVNGANLDEVLTWCPDGKGLAPDHAGAIVSEIAGALQYAHGLGIVHRDVKPGNIVLGSDGRPRLVDFGLAKQLLGAGLHHTRHVGTPAYWAPEQAAGQPVTAATDIYALGVVLYECLVGQAQFRCLSGQPQLSSPAVPVDLRVLLQRCLDVQPEKRPSAEEMADELVGAGRYPKSQLGVVADLTQSRKFSMSIDSTLAPDSELAGETTTRHSGEDAYGQETIMASPIVPAERAAAAVPAADSQHAAVLSDLARMVRDNASPETVPVTGRSRAPQSFARAKGVGPHATPGPIDLTSTQFAGAPRRQRWHTVLLSIGLLAMGSGLTFAVGGFGRSGDDSENQGVEKPFSAAPPEPVAAAANQLPLVPQDQSPSEEAVLPSKVEEPVSAVPLPAAAPSQPVAKATSAVRRTAMRHESVTVGIVPGGTVYIDGKRIGEAPVTVNVSRGRHRFSGELNGTRVTRRVRIGANPNPIALDLMHATQHSDSD